MKNFLKELYDNFPELENSNEKVDKAVYYLKDNKPFYAASNEFKTKLKTRLENITSLTSTKKSNFFIFSIPVFSLLFIVFGFAYYFKDITFLNDDNNNGIITINNLKEEEIITIEANDNTIERINYSNDDKKYEEVLPKTDNLDEKQNQYINKTKIISDDNLENDNNLLNENGIKNTISGNNKKLEDENDMIENDDIIQILGALGEMYPDSRVILENTSSENFYGDNISGIESSPVMTRSTPFFIDSDNVDDHISFEEYCETSSGSIFKNKDVKLCKVNEKYCLSSEYINGVCEFKKIK